MKTNTRLLISTAALIIVLGGSYYLYGELKPGNAIPTESVEVGTSDVTESTEPNTPEPSDVTASSESVAAESSDTVEDEDEKIQYLDVELTDADDNKVMLSDFVGSYYVVVNFWATWCGPCKYEMPHFYKMESEYKDKNVVFLMINLNDGIRETKEAVEKYLAENELDFEHVLFDTTGEPSGRYGVSSIPATLFIDLDGNITGGHLGAMEEETLKGYLDDLIAQ